MLMSILSACSSLFVSTKMGEINVDTKAKQPRVIVNSCDKNRVESDYKA
jgi:hypothetical protein